ncbi:hypothetical protein JNW88_00050 [Micromonospora sp. ATA32]|nr:hypothetical protein [Micromonospora sp. ATA32]
MTRTWITDADLQGFLVTRSPLWLAERLVTAAGSDPVLRAELQAAASGGVGVDHVRQELDRALWVADYVDEEDAPTYVAGVDRALGLLDKLITDGATDETVELAEHAVDLLADAVEKVQGEGEAQESLRWAVQIHVRAVTAARPDPAKLAERLFARAVADDWGVFADAVGDYAEPLGSVGRDRLRKLIGEELGRLPRMSPDETAGGEHRYSVLKLAERVARADGVDAVVDVLSYTLTSARAFTRICRELVEAGRPEQAVGWAERGLSECGTGRVDHGLAELRQLTIDLYATLGRGHDAAELAWRDFEARPALDAYQRLHRHAQADGTWPQRRDKALAVLRAQPRLDENKPTVGPYTPAGHSTLVHVFLWEDDVDAAWRAAQDGGCAEGLWLVLARRRAEQHPADAVGVLRHHIDAVIASGKRDAYDRAAGLLTELWAYHDRLGTSADFADHVRAVRAANSRRRNLLAALDRADLPR